jgi:4-amino-4-deoxy-L-arabinose transferase
VAPGSATPGGRYLADTQQTSSEMLGGRRLLWWLLALYVLVYILPLGQRPLWTPDETRYAEIAREMRQSGDWVSPRLNGKRYFEKPVMGYWLVALSQEALGETGFAARVPSALTALLGLLATYWLVRRSGGAPLAAALAAGVLLTCGLYYGVGTYLVLDMMLTTAVTAGLAWFFAAYRETRALPRNVYLVLFGLACGAAFLIKGFVGLTIPCVAIAPFVFWQQFPEGLWPVVRARRLGALLRAALASAGQLARLIPVPLAAAAAVALPWSVMIHQREPDFWRYFFWIEHVERFLGGKAQHAQPFWKFYFVYVLILGALPWSAFLPAAAASTRGPELRSPFTRFLICWTVFPFLLFSASSGKLGTYVLPCLPPLAILIAGGVCRYLETGARRAFNLAALVPAGVLLLGGAGVVVWQAGGWRPVLFAPGETWKLLAGCAGLLAWAGCAWLAVRARNAPGKLVLVMAAPLASCFLMNFVVPARIVEGHSAAALLERNRERIPPESRVYSRDCLVHACAWHLRRTDIVLFDNVGEFRYGILRSPDPGPGRIKPTDFGAAVAQAPRESLFTLAIEADRYEEIRAEIPEPFFKDGEGKFLLLQFRGGGLDPAVQSAGLRDARRPTPAPQEFTFFAYGDTRSSPDGNAAVAGAILAEAERLKQFAFVLHSGDFADSGADSTAFKRQFLKPAAAMMARLPFLAVRGNHDRNSTAILKKYLWMTGISWGPAGAWDYCFDYGSVRLVVLDQYDNIESGDPRAEWIEQKLAEAPDRWRLVAFHEPIYSTGPHEANLDFRRLVEPILVRGRVHAVFSGHGHAYERFRPINGVTHIVSGGDGAQLDATPGAHPAPSVKYEPASNFLEVAVSPDKLEVRALKPSATGGTFEEFDRVEIKRDCGWPASIPAPHVEYGERYEVGEHCLWIAGAAAVLLLIVPLVRRLARRKQLG